MELFEGTDPTTPRVLVLFTDGDENYSKREVGEIIKAAKESNVNIFCVAFGYTKDEEMKMLASYTGGKFYKVYSREQMINVFRDIYNSLRYYYLITYKPPKYWGWHTVFSYLNLPNRADSLIAMGEYDTSDLWKDVGDEFVRPILFDFNKWDLKEDAIPIIEEIVDAMLTRPRLRLEIQGHTDNIGTQEYNLQLSENRAKAVYDAIVARGVEPSRLRYRGFGFAKPVASNATEEGRARNRRTQFVVLAR
ncbi:MAG TPA: OmpA family protein [Candidatus Kapabacteria bacterium]|nr:OmpA family protein [Candidatus Kapabacteria bacterium]